ncbi:MAG: branched-chain amino acid transport system substrate-binding protein [Actinomycetota bacterium]|nr:branched-chain amino acid transport system substrate-binding protein [Actinomycetota bacterium]
MTLLALACSLVLSACGTRLSNSQAQQQLSTLGEGGSVAAGTGAPQGTTSGAGTTDGSTTTGGAPAGTSGGGAGTGTAATGGSAGGGTGAAGSTGGTGGTAGGATTGSGAGSGATTGAATSGGKAPIVVGMNCNCSGVIGAANAPSRDAYRAWVQATNAKGGIDGHPIKLLYADDNNSSSQDLSNVKQFVEQGKAIALVNFYGAAGGNAPVAQYAQKAGIPIVGGDGYSPEWTKYPSMFSTATSDEAQDYGWAAELKAAGNKKVGAIYCVEGQVCADKEAVWKKFAQQLGLNVAYESQKSLASPDFSSDCLSARNAGVEGMVPILDGASATRVARDCTRQNYKPTFIVSQPFDNPPATLEGAIAPIGSFPWFLTSGSPALTEYGQALAKYAASGAHGSYSATGWANAKLLEKALTGRVSATPKPADVQAGLWAMKGETLGGLTAPLTFTKGKNASPIKCSFRAVVKGGKWTAPVGMKLVDCQP